MFHENTFKIRLKRWCLCWSAQEPGWTRNQCFFRGVRSCGRRERRGGRRQVKHLSNHLLPCHDIIFLCFLHVQNTTGRRPGKQQKKDQPRRARSLYDDGHLEDVERFYGSSQESNERAQSVSGGKILETSREPSASGSEEEKKSFVFN